MKLSLIALSCLLCGAAAIPDKLPTGRRAGKQADTGYGSPEAAPDAAYGAPGGAGDSLGDGLAGYEGDGLDAQASDESLSVSGLSDEAAGSDPLDMLMKAVPGIPGEDYPIFAEAPETAFTCDGQVNGGYYADEEAECQVFHICTSDAEGGLTKYSFLCPNGTIFNQEYFICDWWFNVDCSESAALAAEKNAALEADREAASASLSESSDYDSASDAAAPGGYQAADASAPVASYGVADEDYEEPQPAYNSFRF